MVHKEYDWSLGGQGIYAQAWLPDKDPVSVVNLIHGMGEHSGRYHRWGELFAGSGRALVAMDLFGHGKTEGKTGHVKSYRLLLDQVDLMLERAAENFPDVPRVLYGHSMGGNVAINYAISKDPPVSALIASSPWLRLAIPVSGVEKAFSKITSSLAPGLRVKAKGVTAERLSHDPDHWTDLRNDPLVHRLISARYFYDVVRMGEYALKHIYRINKPFLLMHGNADEITSYKASEEFVANTSVRTELKIWEGLRHELHNEFEYREVFGFVVGWLKKWKL